MKWAVLAVAILTGCAGQSYVSFTSGSARGGVVVQASSSTSFATLGLLLGLVVIAFASDDLRGATQDGSRAAPELDPNRSVSEQDCSKPIDYTQGNIRCK